MEEYSDQSLKLSATSCSEYSCMKSPRHAAVETRVCLVNEAASNVDLIQALKNHVKKMEVLVFDPKRRDACQQTQYHRIIMEMHLDTPYLISKDGSEYIDNDDPQYETIFVLEEFEGEIFHKLQHSDNRVLGTPVVMFVAATNEPLPYTYRPQFCSSMQGLNVCFTNFKTKEHMARLIKLCHYMGASIKKDISAKIDYLITNALHGSKYRTAVSLGIPVLKEDWVHLCWAERKRFGVSASDDEFVLACKSKPFEGCILSFLGFSDKESQHMQEQAIQQGAQTANVGDLSCTHLVVEEDNVKMLSFQPHTRLYIVIQEWFWGSIQIEARAEESMYLFEVAEQRPSLTRSSTCSSLLGTPQKWRNSNETPSLSRASSSSRHSFSRKRSRLREETLAKLAQDSDAQPPKKRQSTDTSACINESLLDISNNSSAARSLKTPDEFRATKRFELKEYRNLDCSCIEPRNHGVVENNTDVSISEAPSKIHMVEKGYTVRKRKSLKFEKDFSVAFHPDSDESLHSHNLETKRRKIHENMRFSLQCYNSTGQFAKQINSRNPFDDGGETSSAKKPTASARYQVCIELLQTEKNYVGILNTILNLFKKPLEDPKQVGGSILPAENIKAIFGSLPEIYLVHTSMAADLSQIIGNWSDSSCIGSIVQKYAKEFVRCYPPFVNFFEMSKEMIESCESSMPRFHAFLKINQAKKECGRQTLAELLINPVQRLPRIILLLQDIKKHTEKENESHADITGIQTALNDVKEVMSHINEDKRKTESQKQIFDIVYEVDGCPPTVVSSHRQFITRAEAITVDDNLTNKGDHVCLFLFSDCVEIAKRKRGMKTHSFRSPSIHSRSNVAVRCLKHVKLISLSHIKKVVDIKNSDDCQNAFSLFCRTPTDSQDWLYTFKMMSCGNDKTSDPQPNATLTQENGKLRLLNLLARHRANTVCKTSDDNFIHKLASQDLDVCTSDIGSTLGRAVRAAKKSHKKLTRAFSFTRTSRRVAQHAVSNKIIPSSKSAISDENITPGLGATPSRLMRSNEREQDSPLFDRASSSTGLTPRMRDSNLDTAQQENMSSLKGENIECSPANGDRRVLKPSVSMMNLPTPAEKSSYIGGFKAAEHQFQIPTPPVRRKKVGAAKAVKAATVAIGRAGSFRRKNKNSSWL